MGRALGRRVRLPGPSRKLGQRPSAANARPIALLPPLAKLNPCTNYAIIFIPFLLQTIAGFQTAI